MKTKRLLWCLWVVAALFVAVQPAMSEEIKGIKNLRLVCSSDTIVNGIEIYELTCGVECTVEIKYWGYPHDEVSTKPISDEQLKEIIDILNKYEIWKWDGFREYDPHAKGGESFSFSLITQDDKTILADGYEMYPENYEEFTKELLLVFGVNDDRRMMLRMMAEEKEIAIPVPITIEEIKRLHFGKSGTTVNGGVIYELTCGDKCTVKIKLDGQPYEEAKTYPISDEQVKEMIDTLNKYEVWRWNGFDEHNPDVRDGGSFYFSVNVQDGKTIEANGYMIYPENYGEVIGYLLRVFNSLEEGDPVKEDHSGVLVPVIIGAGALVIVLVVLGIVRRRRKSSRAPLLWSVLLAAVLSVAVQPAMSQEIKGIKNLRFISSSGSTVNGIEICELTYGYKYTVEIKDFGRPFDETEKKKISDEDVKKVIDVLNKYEIWKWDGFRQADPHARGGDSFYFSLITLDDKTISANGYMMYPENYTNVINELLPLLGLDEERRHNSYLAAKKRSKKVAPVPITIEEIKNFRYYYSTGIDVDTDELYELTCGDECTVKIKPYLLPPEEAQTYPVSDEQVKKLIDLFNKYEVWKWDGFDEGNPNVRDGESFSFSLTVQDGKEINAHGYKKRPENFGEVALEILFILKEDEEEEEAAPVLTNIETISELYYYCNGSELFELNCGDECTVKIRPGEQAYGEAKEYPISDEQVKEMIDILNKYEVWKWDGFDEHDPDADYSDNFAFSLTVQDDIRIWAEGTGVYPENYEEVMQVLNRIIEECEENSDSGEKEEEGNGILVPVLIGAGALVIVLVVVGVARKRKKASANH